MTLSAEKLGSLLDEDPMEDWGRQSEKQKQRSWGRKEWRFKEQQEGASPGQEISVGWREVVAVVFI